MRTTLARSCAAVAFAALLLAGACEAEPESGAALPESCTANEDDDVREAAFRWLFEHQGGGTGVACLGIAHGEVFGNAGTAPASGFLDRFDDLDLSLYIEARCRYSEEPEVGGYVHMDGEPAVIFRVGSVCRDGDTAITSWERDRGPARGRRPAARARETIRRHLGGRLVPRPVDLVRRAAIGERALEAVAQAPGPSLRNAKRFQSGKSSFDTNQARCQVRHACC